MTRPVIPVEEKPILFTAQLVNAILEDRKLETRRLITRIISKDRVSEFGPSTTPGYDFHFRDRYALWNDVDRDWVIKRCPYGKPGSQLWVRETWGPMRGFYDPAVAKTKPSDLSRDEEIIYRATHEWGDSLPVNLTADWRPSIHMPRWASRIDLKVEEIRIEPLHEIDELGALAEGCLGAKKKGTLQASNGTTTGEFIVGTAREEFRRLWDAINAKRGFGWESNPYVWVVRFSRIRKGT